MPNSLLNDLKLIVIALIWLFFLRAMRATWVEVRHTARVKESRRDRKERAKLEATIASLAGSHKAPGRSGASSAAVGSAVGGSALAGGHSTHHPTGDLQARGAGGQSEVAHTVLTVAEPLDRKGDQYFLYDEISVIGRATGCAVLLESDTYISHQHARIFRRGEEVWIEDLGSTNGTYVNSKKLTSPVPLKNEDKVRVGNTLLEVAK